MSDNKPFMPTVILTDSQQKQLKAAQISEHKYTADELRQFAKAKKEQVVREKKELERTKRRMTIADANRWVILEQDADALEQGADAMDALTKAEARVKELERALQWDKTIKGVEELANELREGRQEHNAATQVKP